MYKSEHVNQIARSLELYYDDPTCSWEQYERIAEYLYESGCRMEEEDEEEE